VANLVQPDKEAENNNPTQRQTQLDKEIDTDTDIDTDNNRTKRLRIMFCMRNINEQTTTHCNTLQHTAAHCNTPQHTPPRSVTPSLLHETVSTEQTYVSFAKEPYKRDDIPHETTCTQEKNQHTRTNVSLKYSRQCNNLDLASKSPQLSMI